MLPVAPGRLSTTTGCPIDRLSLSAILRALTSRTPPAAAGTMILIGRDGKACVMPDVGMQHNRPRDAMCRTLLLCIRSSPDQCSMPIATTSPTASTFTANTVVNGIVDLSRHHLLGRLWIRAGVEDVCPDSRGNDP